jgi:U4/U6.U5 tri-snRNP component SNU23|tara:strand:- start:93 stop:785 length:693 start_codon:yes stop_codon:yes gene_type:complete
MSSAGANKDELKSQHGRRTWDDAENLLKAKRREEQGGEDEPMAVAPVGMSGPAGSQRAYLNHGVDRSKGIRGMKSMLGRTRMVTDAAARSKAGPGKWCSVCEVSLRDSVAWVDHINGKRHQRKLGFSMRVERSSVGDVASALAAHAAQRAKDKAGGGRKRFSAEMYRERIAELKRKEEVEASAKRAAKRQRKNAAKGKGKAASAASEAPPADAAMMAMMGFGGFGGSKKS